MAGDAIANTVTFGDLLRNHRLAAGLTQDALAERAGLSTRGISDLERGSRVFPRRDTVAMLAAALDLSGEELTSFRIAARRPVMSLRHYTTTATEPRSTDDPFSGARLPIPPDRLVGREREVTAVAELLRDPTVRLATVTGMGGIGKTRVAIAVAAAVQPEFAHGVAFIDLAATHDPELVLESIGRAVGARAVRNQAFEQSVIACLRARNLLLVLDNFEQVLTAAPIVARLLAACPDLVVLVTSRSPLRLTGEHRFALSPLAVPRAGEPLSLGKLASSAAAALFIARARQIDPGFGLTEANAAAVAAICRRLDGLPLAIELAAARIGYLAPAEILARLERGLALLSKGPRDAPPRLQTMRNAITWSYDLLSPDVQANFRRLAVCEGGFRLDAVEAIAGQMASAESDVLEDTSTLIDASLISPMDTGAGTEPRFTMLETVRAFGLEALAAHGEENVARRAQAGWCLALAERAAPELKAADQLAWLERLESELGNLRAVLTWASEHDPALALRLASSLGWFWYLRGDYGEGRRWLSDVLAGDRKATPYRARAFADLGILSMRQGDFATAESALRESLAMARRLGERATAAYAQLMMARGIAYINADYAEMRALSETSLAEYRALDHAWGIAAALVVAGSAAMLLADEDANRLIAESLDRFRMIGDAWGIAYAANAAGILATQIGDDVQAERLYEECRQEAAKLGNRHSVAIALHNIAHVAMRRGELDAADTALHEALQIMWHLGDRGESAANIIALAAVAALRGDAERAGRLAGAGFAMLEAVGEVLEPLEQEQVEEHLNKAQSALGAETYARAWANGAALTDVAAVAEALLTASISPVM